MISAKSYESRLIAALCRERFSARAILEYLRSLGVYANTAAVIYYHAKQHDVGLGYSRNDGKTLRATASRLHLARRRKAG